MKGVEICLYGLGNDLQCLRLVMVFRINAVPTGLLGLISPFEFLMSCVQDLGRILHDLCLGEFLVCNLW